MFYAAGVSYDKDVGPSYSARAAGCAHDRRRRRRPTAGRQVHQHLLPLRLSQSEHEGGVQERQRLDLPRAHPGHLRGPGGAATSTPALRQGATLPGRSRRCASTYSFCICCAISSFQLFWGAK